MGSREDRWRSDVARMRETLFRKKGAIKSRSRLAAEARHAIYWRPQEEFDEIFDANVARHAASDKMKAKMSDIVRSEKRDAEEDRGD